MKSITSIIFAIAFVTSMNAKEFPGYYVKLNGDTIQCTFDVRVNMFKKKLLNQLSFRKKVKIIVNGTTIKYQPNQIKMFQIDSTSQGSEKYIPLQVDRKLWFVRVVEEGEINLYEFFYPHGYDGSVMMKYVVQKQNKLPQLIPALSWRKKLTKYLDNDESLNNEINQKENKYMNIPEIIVTYNLKQITATKM